MADRIAADKDRAAEMIAAAEDEAGQIRAAAEERAAAAAADSDAMLLAAERKLEESEARERQAKQLRSDAETEARRLGRSVS